MTEPEPEPTAHPGAGAPKVRRSRDLLAALAVLALGGGPGGTSKSTVPSSKRRPEPEEDYSSYDEPDDYDDAPPWDVERRTREGTSEFH